MPRYEPTPLETSAQIGDVYEQLRRIQAQLGAGGVAQIVTSTTRPTSPAVGDVIYELDTSSLLAWDGFAWRLPWNQPWGRQADVKVTVLASGLGQGGYSDFPSVFVSWTATKDRRYEISANVPIRKHTTAFANIAVTDAAGTIIGQDIGTYGDLDEETATISGLEWVPIESGPVTLKMRVLCSAGTVDLRVDPQAPAWLHVDDVGPATLQVAPIPQGTAPPPSPGTFAVVVTTPTPATQIVAGSTVTIGAAAQPDPGQTITQVEFFVDGALLGTDAGAPYQTSWINVVAGPHALTARATQSGGATVTSPTINVTVTTQGGGGGGEPPPPTGSNPSKLTVQGLLLKDPGGVTVTLAGVNQYIVPAFADSSNQMVPLTNWFEANLARVADEWATKGVNCVRIPIMYDTNTAYTQRIVNAVTTLGARGIYVILTALDPVSFGVWPTHPGDPVNDTARIAAYFLQNMWAACGMPSHLMLELWHEPVGTALTATEWQSGVQTAITILRTPGAARYDGPIFITTRNWGWSFDTIEATAVKAGDPNVVFCSHRFAVSSPTSPPLPATDPAQAWRPSVADAAVSAGVALLVAMFGIYNGGYGVGGSKIANAQGWGAAMAIEIEAAVDRGQCVGGLSWMWLWGAMEPGEDDQNSMVDPVWQQVTTGTAWTSNAWGLVVYSLITNISTGGGPPPPPPTGSPTVTVSAPTSAVAGSTVALTATATPASGQTITSVAFLVDGAVIATDTTSPYSASWTAVAGQHSITARATQSDAAVTTSTAVNILVSTPPAPSTEELRVSGTGFLDKNGSRLVLRGVAQYLLEYASGGSGAGALYSWFSGHMAAVALDWKQKGVNACRIMLTYDTSAAYINDLKAKVDALWAQGIFSIINAFDNADFGNYASNTAPDRMIEIWQAIGSPKYCFVESNNEPNGITAAQWQTGMSNWITRARAAGYNQVLFLGARDWSWTFDLTQSLALKAQDPQICIVNHTYAVTDPGQPVQPANYGSATWKPLWPDQAGPNGICFIINEWGPWNGAPCTAFGVGGSYNANIDGWGENMRQEIQAAVAAQRMGGALGWMWAWSDPNGMTGPDAPCGPTAVEQSTGPPWALNRWGQKMFSMVSVLAGTPTAPGPPTVTHSAPSTGTTGVAVSVTATATPGTGATITNTNLLVDGVSVAGDTVAPYAFTWSAGLVTAGTHSLKVRATQSDGQIRESTPTNIVITNPGVLTVAVTFPADGANLQPGPITVTASATPATGQTITNVQFFVDSVSIATDTTSPYTAAWTAPSGPHSIFARATQSDAAVLNSATINVTVASAPPPPSSAGELHVSGTVLKNASNQTVFLRGVAQYIVTPYPGSGTDYLFSWFDQNIGRVADEWYARGVRCVSMPIRVFDTSTAYKDFVKRIVTAVINRGMYISPRCFEAFGDDYNTANGIHRANILLTHWNWCGRPAMMLLNTWNEPNNNGSLSNAQWLTTTEAMRQTVRNGGYTGPFICDANIWATVNGGTNGNGNFITLINNDSAFGGNMVFSQHRYHALCSSGYLPNNWGTSTGLGGWNSNGVCWVMGEFGWFNCYPDGPIAGSSIFVNDMVDAIIASKNANTCAGAWAWMWTWDWNSLVDPSQFNITQGAQWSYNFWGQAALRMWANTAAGV